MLVLLVTGGLLSLGVFGSIHIVQRWDPGIVNTGIYSVNLSNLRFDPNRMLPADSYLSKWIGIQQHYYSGYGFQAVVSLCDIIYNLVVLI